MWSAWWDDKRVQNYSRDPGVERRIILKWIVSSHSEQMPVVDSSEQDIELSCSIKGEDFLAS